LPTIPQEIEVASEGINSISSHGVMEGCVAAIDGILLRTITPPKKSVGHVKSLFSGHYYAYGLNILAACDHHCRFLYVACQAPGGSNDITAYRNLTLPSYVEELLTTMVKLLCTSSRQWWNQFNATLNFAKADARTRKTSSCLDNESIIASLLIHSYHIRFNTSSVLR